MLDVALTGVSLASRVHDITITFEKSTHTAIVGPPASGVSTLLRLIAGEIRPDAGTIQIGARDVTSLRASRRPLLYATREIDAPLRWSVRHLLVAAVRQRSLDRVDRQREFELAASKWKLENVLDRSLGTLSTSERTLAHAARIELLKPAILVADRLLDYGAIADEIYRTLRVMGTTVINAPASIDELGYTDRVVVLDRGRIIQQGSFSQIYRQPVSEAAAIATGEVNLIPVTIRGTNVQAPIGSWDLASAPFQGEGVALARPEDFQVPSKGEESDLIFGIEEATFRRNHWQATGFLTGGLVLRVSLPAGTEVHKGRLLPLRFDSQRLSLLKR